MNQVNKNPSLLELQTQITEDLEKATAGIDYLQSSADHLQQLLSIYQETVDESLKDSISFIQRLAWLHYDNRNYTAAEPYFQQMVDLTEGGDDINHTDALHHLGALYLRMNRFKEAEEHFSQALDIDRRVFGDDDPKIAATLNDLAHVYEQTNRLVQAEATYQKALEIKRRHYGETHDSVALAFHNLASFYHGEKRYAEAKPLYQQALNIREQVLGKSDPKYANSLSSIALLYLDMSELTQASQSFAQACQIFQNNMPGSFQYLLNSKLGWGKALFLSGDLDQAEVKWATAANSAGKKWGGRHPYVVEGLRGLVDLYTQQKNFRSTKQVMLRLLPVLADLYGVESEDFTSQLQKLTQLAEQIIPEEKRAFQLFDIGEDFYNQDEYAVAHAVYEKTLQRLQESDFLYRIVLYAMGNMQRSLGNYHQAEKLLRQSLDNIEKNEGSEFTPHSLYYAPVANVLGGVLGDLGRYQESLLYYQKALDIYSFQNLSEKDRADATLQQVMAGSSEIGEILSKGSFYSEPHPSTTGVRQNMVKVHIRAGNYAEAVPLLDAALAEAKVSLEPVSEEYANLHSIAGALFVNTGDVERAEQHLSKATQIARIIYSPAAHRLAMHLNNEGVLYQDLEQYDKAQLLLEEASKIWLKTLGPDHPDYTEGLVNLASLYQDLGNLELAGSILGKIFSIRMDNLGYDHPATIQAMNNVGAFYLRLGSYAKAEAMLKLATRLRRRILGEAHPLLAITLSNLVTLYAEQGQMKEAMSVLEQEAEIHLKTIGFIFSVTSSRHRLAYLTSLRFQMRSMMSVIWQIAHEMPEFIPQAFDLLLQRKGLSLEALTIQQTHLLRDCPPDLAEDFEKLVEIRQKIADRYLAGPGSDGVDVYHQTLNSWETEKEELESILARNIPELNLTAFLLEANRQNIADSLPSKSVLVDFTAVPFKNKEGTDRYLAFVLPAGEPDNVSMFDLGEAKPIEQLIKNFRSKIIGNSTRDLGRLVTENSQAESEIQIGRKLRAVLFDPLASFLHKYQQIFLAPDGNLTQLPFEVLPTDDGRRLIDDYCFSYLSVGRDVLRFSVQSTGQSNAPIVVANPDFDLADNLTDPQKETKPATHRQSKDINRANLTFAPLSSTEIEGIEIAEKLKVRPLMGQEALEGTLKASRSPVVLHIATHGFFLENQKQGSKESWIGFDSIEDRGDYRMTRLHRLENPLLRSGLALAGANAWHGDKPLPPQAEDGILTAEEVSNMDLFATELVVLSACETGLGEVQVSEGVFGLRRAFVLAGAKTLVMSLWKVPDKQTQELMTDFYARILAGEPRSEALRQAQAKMKERYPDPFFWGAFICQGDPGPLIDLPPEDAFNVDV